VSNVTPPWFYGAAHHWRMRAEEARTFADELKEGDPKTIMLRVAADYERLAEWVEKNSMPWWDKKSVGSK
jgi:hypothetical protein